MIRDYVANIGTARYWVFLITLELVCGSTSRVAEMVITVHICADNTTRSYNFQHLIFIEIQHNLCLMHMPQITIS